MTDVLALYPDAEAVMCDLLEPLAPSGTWIDPNWDGAAQFIVHRVGGSDDGVTDHPVVEVAAYGPDRQSAWLLARQAQQVVLAAASTAVNGVFIDFTETSSGAQELPDLDPDDRKVSLTYVLQMRRQFT